jgi:hypothetical protein
MSDEALPALAKEIRELTKALQASESVVTASVGGYTKARLARVGPAIVELW